MKKNLYYRHVYRRRNVLGEAILNAFLAVSSGPRLLLEVFIRRNMGERYYSTATAVLMVILLTAWPLFMDSLQPLMGARDDFGYRYTTWYLFIAAFIYFCILRASEVQRLPSVFDFARFSLSTGEIHPRFYEFEQGRGPGSIRRIETLLEPGLFAVIGLALMILGQALGGLLLLCSLVYSLSYMAAYNIGDHFIMDKIDEMICNEEMVNTFVEGRDASQTRGVKYYGRRPADPDIRRKLVESFIEETPETVEAF